MTQTKRIWLANQSVDCTDAILGIKGRNIADIARLKVASPPAFTLSTECCKEFLACRSLSPVLLDEIASAVSVIEHQTGRRFGDTRNPLLLAVRVGSPEPIGPLMPSIVNIGINDEIAEQLIDLTGNPRFVYDSYCQLIVELGRAAFSSPVSRLRMRDFLRDDDDVKAAFGITTDGEMPIAALRQVCAIYKARVRADAGRDFPQNVHSQLKLAIEAGFRSWTDRRPGVVRMHENIADGAGCSITVQSMVFGNVSDDSGVGVCAASSWDKSDTKLYGQFAPVAQRIEPRHLSGEGVPLDLIERDHRRLGAEIRRVRQVVTARTAESVVFDFIVERGKVYVIRTRPSSLTTPSAVLSAYRDLLAAKHIGEFGLSLGEFTRTPREQLTRTAA